MAWTQGDVDKLDVAIASGVQSVTFDGPPRRTVTYQTTSDMLKARAIMVAEVAKAGGRTNIRYLSTSKGF
jgi:hypothetical protein